jgi:peptidoglycan/LPS O-acetylase OafA/YrhL
MPRLMKLSNRRLIRTSAVLWIVSLIGPAYFMIAVLGHSAERTQYLWEMALLFHPLVRLIPFLIGVAAGILFLRCRDLTLPAVPLLTSVTALGIMVAYAIVPTPAGRLLENALTPIFAVLVYLLALERGTLSRFLSRPIFVLLGEASYSMYILHNPLWNYIARRRNIISILFERHFPTGLVLPGHPTEWNHEMSIPVFITYLVILIGGSVLVLLYIERPARVYLMRRFENRRRHAGAVQVAASAS